MTPKLSAKPFRILNIGRIRTDGGTQGRVVIDASVVQEYSGLMESGAEFPPVRVWFDGNEYWLSDGFHRLAAARQIGVSEIYAEVILGSLDDARWDSYSANSAHGIRRTSTDFEAIIKRVLDHPRSRELSNYEIARHLNIPETTFRRWRKRLTTPDDVDATRLAVRQGKTYRLQTVNIGKQRTILPTKKPAFARIAREFETQKTTASPRARRVLNIVEKWIRGDADTFRFLSAIESLLESFKYSGEPTPEAGLTVLLTGLSSAGKSTIARTLREKLDEQRYRVELLDGDEVRQHLSRGLGFSKEDRTENLRRIGFVAERLTRNGIITVISAIAPYRAAREELRLSIGHFLEVYVNAPLEICEERDHKGIYRRKRRGEMEGVTGIDDPYEAPLNPDVECHTDRETVTQSVMKVLAAIQVRVREPGCRANALC